MNIYEVWFTMDSEDEAGYLQEVLACSEQQAIDRLLAGLKDEPVAWHIHDTRPAPAPVMTERFRTSKKAIKARTMLRELEQVVYITREVLGEGFPDQCAGLLHYLLISQQVCSDWDGTARGARVVECDLEFALQTAEATCRELCELVDINPLC